MINPCPFFYNSRISPCRYHPSEEGDDAGGFDDHYFRRRPKSFCVPPGPPMLPPGASPFPPPSLARQLAYEQHIHLSMGSLLEEQQRAAAQGGTLVSRHL